MIVGSMMKVFIFTILLVIGFAYCKSPVDTVVDGVSPPDPDVILDTIDQWLRTMIKVSVPLQCYDVC